MKSLSVFLILFSLIYYTFTLNSIGALSTYSSNEEFIREMGMTVKCESPWQNAGCFKVWYKQLHDQYKGALPDQGIEASRQ